MRRLCADPGGTGGHTDNMQVQPHKADLDHDSELHVGLGYYYQGRYVRTQGHDVTTSLPSFVIQDVCSKEGSI